MTKKYFLIGLLLLFLSIGAMNPFGCKGAIRGTVTYSGAAAEGAIVIRAGAAIEDAAATPSNVLSSNGNLSLGSYLWKKALPIPMREALFPHISTRLADASRPSTRETNGAIISEGQPSPGPKSRIRPVPHVLIKSIHLHLSAQ